MGFCGSTDSCVCSTIGSNRYFTPPIAYRSRVAPNGTGRACAARLKDSAARRIHENLGLNAPLANRERDKLGRKPRAKRIGWPGAIVSVSGPPPWLPIGSHRSGCASHPSAASGWTSISGEVCSTIEPGQSGEKALNCGHVADSSVGRLNVRIPGDETRPLWRRRRAGSSVGRALRSQCRGRGFDSLPVHLNTRALR